MSKQITFSKLSCDSAGVVTQFDRAIRDVLIAWNEQDCGERKDGDCKVVLEVLFDRQPGADGAAVSCTCKVGIPARCSAEGKYAQIVGGELSVCDAEQQELPGVLKLNKRED
ncbi:MAG TPA: hypothetical protein DEB56_10055 [Thiobacillus sp.]|nr:hypothetical protein [Thiobacillus sp.]